MTASSLLLRLPLLHREFVPAEERGAWLSLWPGLPGMPAEGFWAPAYPFRADEAAACVEDMRRMSEAALSGVPVRMLAATQANAGTRRDAAELAGLEAFSRGGDVAGGEAAMAADLERRAAQKVLLWAWLLEENALELRRLVHSCTAGEARLARELDEEGADAAVLTGMAGTRLSERSDLLPPWRVVLEHAAVFLPEQARILVENQDMRESLLDLPGCPPAVAGRRELCVPLWRVLGRRGPRCPRQETPLRLVLLEPAGE